MSDKAEKENNSLEEIKGQLNDTEEPNKKDSNKKDKKPRPDTAKLLFKLAMKNGDLFKSDNEEGYIQLKEKGHLKTIALKSKKFTSFLMRECRREYSLFPSDSALKRALRMLEAEADDEKAEKLYKRYAYFKEKVYIDLCNEDWKIAQIDKAGYKIINAENAPIKFERKRNFKSLPIPEKTGDIELLKKHALFKNREDYLLSLAWLLDAMVMNSPFPVLEIGGEAGATKTSTQSRLRDLIDPNIENNRREPRDVETIFITAKNNHIVSFDNISFLGGKKQDALCILATGGADVARKQYTDDEEHVIQAMNPVILNGINQVITRPDLADRSVSIELLRVPDSERIEKLTLDALWVKDRPKIQRALYDLLSKTLKELPKVKLQKNPRMADFARLGQAMLNAMGLDESFVVMYERNRARILQRALDFSPVADAVIKLLDDMGDFKGIKKELLNELAKRRPSGYNPKYWPDNPRALGGSLRHLAPAFRSIGIEVRDEPRKGKGIGVTIRRIKPEQANVKEVVL